MARIVSIVALALFIGGCASGGGRSAVLAPASRYAETFESAKEELISRGFALERVDARHGLIVSTPVSTAGLATPRTRTEIGAGGEIDSFLHRDQRRVTIRFSAAGDGDKAPAADLDLRSYDGPIVAHVAATRERMHRPGLRLSSAGVRLTSVGDSPGRPDIVTFDAGEDVDLAAAVARGIARRAGVGLVDTPDEKAEGAGDAG